MLLVVPGVGIEPTRPRGRGILSPLRLPVSPSGRAGHRLPDGDGGGNRPSAPFPAPPSNRLPPRRRGAPGRPRAAPVLRHGASPGEGPLARRGQVRTGRHDGGHGRRIRKTPAGAGVFARWRPGSELNRRTRICSPLHDHSATRPVGIGVCLHAIVPHPAPAAGRRGRGRRAGRIRKTPAAPGFSLELERETRLELATPTLARSCSTN